jgi:hypothetical protein
VPAVRQYKRPSQSQGLVLPQVRECLEKELTVQRKRASKKVHPYIQVNLDFIRNTSSEDVDCVAEKVEELLVKELGWRDPKIEVHY